MSLDSAYATIAYTAAATGDSSAARRGPPLAFRLLNGATAAPNSPDQGGGSVACERGAGSKTGSVAAALPVAIARGDMRYAAPATPAELPR